MATPQPGMYLPSGLWIDDPAAHSHIDSMLETGEVDGTTAGQLRHFVDEGYATFSIDAALRLADDLLADVDRAWQELPKRLAYAYDSPPKRMSRADPERERRPRYRIHDLHSWSEAALQLYLDPTIFRFMELVYQQPAVAIQSLYFEFGSQQQIHRDPVVVPSDPPSHLLAAWISLEDIDPDCGPLQFVPRSHRLPYYEFAPGEFMFDGSRMGAAEIEAGLAWTHELCRQQGLVAEPFLGRRGEVLVWHHSLLHGGAEPRDADLTRNSFVVHFCTLEHYRERAITLEEVDERGQVAPAVLATTETIRLDGRTGFCNPIDPRG